MAIIPQGSLFNWQQVDSCSDLDRLKLVLSSLPDEALVKTLENKRGNGRNDYPIRACFNALIAGIVFQHVSAASLLRELKRNAQLRQVCGFDVFLGADAVPSEDAFGRFIDNLIDAQDMLEQMFHTLVETLKGLLPGLGQKLAVDSKAIASLGKPISEEHKNNPDRRRDHDADWGVKTYHGERQDGSRWEKVVKWFGYKLHLLVDANYEMPLAFSLTKASVSDSTNLLPLCENLKDKHPTILASAEQLSADKGYDSTNNVQKLYDDYDIKPLIDKRTMRKDSDKTLPLYPDSADVVVYDEHGQVSCVCPKTGEQRSMMLAGFEKERQTLKYRCPASAYDFVCKGRTECEAKSAVGSYGRIIRVPLSVDRRIFTPIARPSDKWAREYKTRTAVERVNSRIDQVLGFERHFIRGEQKMRLRLTLGFVVMLAMAVGRIRAGQKEQMRSLTMPIKRAA